MLSFLREIANAEWSPVACGTHEGTLFLEINVATPASHDRADVEFDVAAESPAGGGPAQLVWGSHAG